MEKDYEKLVEFAIKCKLATTEQEFLDKYCYGVSKEELFNDPNGLNYIALFYRACEVHNCIPAVLFERWDAFRLDYIGEETQD